MFKQVQADDPIAFRKVVEQLKGRVFSVSYALLGNSSEADVTAQKVFVRLYHTTGRDTQQRDLIRYAYRLAIEQSLVELRMRRLRMLFKWRTEPTASPDPKGLPTAEENRERLLVVRGLSMLPYRERALLVLKEVADQTVEQIANIMCLDQDTVRRRLFAARKNLQISVAEQRSNG